MGARLQLVGVIPARGGSKGIPRKNLAPCAGRALIDYTIDAAINSDALARIVVSTDSEEIATHARARGVEVPFLRPAALAGDTTPMVDVLQHLLGWLDEESRARGLAPVDAFVLLQPTSPLRTAAHVAAAVARYEARRPESLVSVVEVPHHFNPVSVQRMGEDGRLQPFLLDQPVLLRRQDKPRVYGRNGPAILIVSRANVAGGRLYGASTVGYEMALEDSVDVDTPADLRLAGWLLEKR